MVGAAQSPDRAEPAAFRYTLPGTPVASAAVAIGHVGVRLELYLDGDLDLAVHPHRSTVDGKAVRRCTLQALRSAARGLLVSGLGSYTPSITSTAGHRFSQTRHRFRAPDTMSFGGRCAIGFSQPCDCGIVSMSGAVGYTLDVTAQPTTGKPRDTSAADRGRAWFARNDEELSSIGMVKLIATPVAPGPLVRV